MSYIKNIVTVVLLLCQMAVCSAAESDTIRVADNLYDQNRQETDLGLKRLEGMETVTVFSPDDNTDHFSNGVCMAGFNGALYCMWQSSKEYEDSPDTWVAYSRSTDDGKTWSRPMVLAESPEVGSVSSGGWLVNDKELVAYINVWNESHKEGYTVYKTSKDGLKWSKERPVLMADGTPMQAVIEQDPHVLSTGRIINAAHFHPGLQAYPIYTDDKSGKAGWHKAQFTPKKKNDDQSCELEPSSFVCADGAIVMLFRDQSSTFRKLAAVSKDNGETWSTSFLTNIPDSRSKQCAGNLPDGRVYFVSNPVQNKFRYPLVITLSKDGKVFDEAYILHTFGELPEIRYSGRAKRKGYSYPKSCIIGDSLYIGYSVNKEKVQYTKIPIKSFF